MLPPGMPRGMGDIPGMGAFDEPGFHPGLLALSRLPGVCPRNAQQNVAQAEILSSASVESDVSPTVAVLCLPLPLTRDMGNAPHFIS
jgi:hypothetical protein